MTCRTAVTNVNIAMIARSAPTARIGSPARIVDSAETGSDNNQFIAAFPQRWRALGVFVRVHLVTISVKRR